MADTLDKIMEIGAILDIAVHQSQKRTHLMKIFEIDQDKDKEKIIHSFLTFAMNRLKLDPNFTVSFSYDTDKARSKHHTGVYNFKNNHIEVYAAHRNTIDILRTLAHELVHAKQDSLGQLHHHDAPGSPHEQDADRVAGYLIKIFVRKHHDIID